LPSVPSPSPPLGTVQKLAVPAMMSAVVAPRLIMRMLSA
jgi:hypothetical protein